MRQLRREQPESPFTFNKWKKIVKCVMAYTFMKLIVIFGHLTD